MKIDLDAIVKYTWFLPLTLTNNNERKWIRQFGIIIFFFWFFPIAIITTPIILPLLIIDMYKEVYDD